MRPLENHQVADHAAVSHDPSWLKGAAAATQSEVTLGGGDASGSDLPIPRQAAFDTVKSFVDADDYGFAKNTDAIAGAIFGDLQAKRTTDELVLIEQIIKEVIDGAAMPKVQVVDNGNIYTSTQETLLPDGVLGAFVPGGPGEAGTILISKDIQDRPDLLADVMLEEVGEAVGDHVHHELSVHPGYDYGDPAPGDVGNRIMQVVHGKPVDNVSFEVTEGGLKEDAPDFDPERDYDERYVMFDGAVTAAKTAADETATAEELAAAWGVEDPDAADLFDIDDAVAKANNLQNGPPWTVESYANIYDFDLVVAHYSADGSMTINEIAHAIFDGAVDLETAEADADGNGLVVANVDESKLADRTDQELADEWGLAVEVVTAARADANEIYTRNGLMGESGFGEGDNDANGWDTMIRVYGQEEAISGLGDSGPVLQVDEMARAIAEGAVTTTVNSNGVVFDAVDLPQISNLALTDAIWLHSEANSQDGGQRVQMPVDLLADSVAAITGDTDGFITDADKALIQSKYADVYFGDVPEPNRFSKDAVQRIWDTEGFMRSSEEPGIFNFRVNAENVEAADPAVPIGGPGEPTDPDEIILAVSEDDEAGTVAGDVAALGAEGATFVLSEGNSGNFELNGTQLVVSADAAFDFDLIPTEMVTIDVTEGDVTTTRSVAVEIISDGNTDPTDVTLSSNTVAADAAANTEIGTLSTTDAEDSGFNYTIIGGDTDEFKMDGNKLMVATPLTQGDTHYSIDVQVTDADGNTFVKTLVIQAGTGISDEDQRRDPGKFLFAAANEVGIEGLEEYMVAAIESGDTNEGGVLSWGEEPPEVLKRAAIKFAISNDAGDLYTTDKVALFMNALSDARRHQESIPDIGTEGLVFDGLEGAGIAAKGHLHVLYNYLEETDGAEAATAFVTEVETHWDSTTLTFDPAYTATLLDLTNAAKELYLEGEVGDNLYDGTGNRVESRYGAQKAQLAAAYDIYGGGAMEAYGEDDAKIYLTNLTDVEAITELHVLRDAGADHVHNHLIDEGHPTTYEDFGEEHRKDLSLHEGLAAIWATVEEAATYVGGVATNIYRTGVELLDFGKQIAHGEIDLGAFIAEKMGDEYLAMSEDLAREGTISRQLSDLAATDDLDHVGKLQVALDIAELFDWVEGATTATRFGNMRSDGAGVHLRSTVNMPHETELADGTAGYTGGLDIQLITMGFQGALTYKGGLAAGITYSSNAFNYQATGSTEANMVENFITGGGAHEYKTGAGLAAFLHLPSFNAIASKVMNMTSQAYNDVQGWFGGSSEAAMPNPADAGIPSTSSNWDLGAVGSIVHAVAESELDVSVSAGYSRTWDMDAIPSKEFLALLGGNVAGMTAGGLGAIYAGATSEKAIMAGLQLGMILEDSLAAAIAPDEYVKEQGFGATFSLGGTSGWVNGASGEGNAEFDVLRGRIQWAKPIWGQDTGFAGSPV